MASIAAPAQDQPGAEAPEAEAFAGGDLQSLRRLLPLVLLVYSIFLPQEMRIVISEQVIYPSRAAVFLVTPWIARSLLLGQFRIRPADGLVFFAAGWMMVSFIFVYGVGDGVLRGGALVLDLLGPYMLARLCIRDIDDLRRLLVILAPGAFFAGFSLLVEVLAGHPIVRPIAASIFGDLPLYEGGVAVGEKANIANYRFGLLRASGPFAHSIFAGLFLASLLPLYALSGLRRWPGKLGVATAVFSLFTLSSAAILGVVLSIGLIAYDWIQRAVSFLNWRLLATFAALSALFIHIASQNGIISILIRMTLNPQTGYYRLLIWRFGVQSVEKFPVFGIGFAVHERPDWMNSSVDSYWLVLAIRHGLAVPAALFLVSIFAILALGRCTTMLEEVDRRTVLGLAIALFVLVIAGFTVAFVGGLLTWFLVILGASLSLTQSARA
ncbi:hypothetical protein [Altererythrobacter sp.]|uniref:hypothetical protein n=1 Tax=Altererythrobacter sp. TaxID=1872480 RepID=UPI003D05766E